MAGMVNNDRSASTRPDGRWWLMVIVLLAGAGTFLVLPSLMLKTTLALPVAAVLIAVGLVAWIRGGSRYRRFSAGLVALFGIVLLAVLLSRPSGDLFLTASAWHTVTACMLMGFALMAGLLTSLEARSRRTRPVADALPAADMVDAPGTAALVLPAPPAVQVHPEILERLLALCKVGLVPTDGGTLSPETVVERAGPLLYSALLDLTARAQTGEPGAQSALDRLRQAANPLTVRQELTQLRQALCDDSLETAQRPDLCRQLAALSLLGGDVVAVPRYLATVLADTAADPLAMEFVALAAEMAGDAAQAELWYTRVLNVGTDPVQRASVCSCLGLIHQTKDELDKAGQMHLAALTINEQLGRLEDVANQSAQLGAVHEMRGQIQQAEEMYRRALTIHQQLGRLEGMASQYVNLGLLASQRDDVVSAKDLWGTARDLYGKAGLVGNARLVQQLVDELAVP